MVKQDTSYRGGRIGHAVHFSYCHVHRYCLMLQWRMRHSWPFGQNASRYHDKARRLRGQYFYRVDARRMRLRAYAYNASASRPHGRLRR